MMSLIDALEDNTLNKDLFHVTDESDIGGEIHETFTSASFNSSAHYVNTAFTGLESTVTAITSNSQSTTEDLAIDVGHKTVSPESLETCLMNFDIPGISGGSNLNVNMTSSLAPPNSIFYGDQPITTEHLWSPHYEYTQSNFAANEYNHLHQ